MTTKNRDKYDEAVAYLTKNPDEIYDAWNMASTHVPVKGSCLFVPCDLTVLTVCGCLTQVRGLEYDAATPRLTRAIRADRGIPKRGESIKPRHLKRFAYWQRRLDKELGRT